MKKMSLVLTLLLLCTFVSYSRAGEVRTWTAGNHSVEGEFVELLENGTIVRIRKTNGNFTRVPLVKLSEEDQEYIKEAENTGTTLPASSRKAGERKVLTVDGIEYAFRWCPPGEFMMGAPESEWPGRPSYLPYDETPHKVKLTKGFWLLETEVTQAMWESVMGENPSEFKGERNPVENVNWDDCQIFCKKLSQKLGQQIQLPTEAQWEYACHAGTTGKYSGDLDSIAWYDENSGNTTHAVGQKKPNAWGLYDMHGNVWEWCSDYYDDEYYAKSPTNDPENTEDSPVRVSRGGNWNFDSDFCRSTFRGWFASNLRSNDIGLRVLLVPGQD